MKILLIIVLAAHLSATLLVSGQCPSVLECSACQAGGQAICGPICPGTSKLPTDITSLTMGNGTCSSWASSGMLRAEHLGTFNSLQVLNLTNSHVASFYPSPSPFTGVANLKVLLMPHNQIKSVSSAVIKGLTHLEELDVSCNNVRTLLSNAFTNLTSLKHLNFANNNISHLNATYFTGLGSLETLTLSNNIIATVESGTFTQLVNVQTIDLEKNNLTDITAGMFANLRSLRNIGLLHNKISTLADDSLYGTSLDKLDLSHNDLTTIPRNALSQTTNKPKTLDLSYNKITQLSSTDLQDLTVQTLDLSGNPIVDINENAFDECSISNINLSNTGLTSLPVTMETWLKSTTATVNLDNPNWSCTCDTIWLARLVDQKTNIMTPTCASSGKYGATSLKAALVKIENDCTTTNTAVTAPIPTALPANVTSRTSTSTKETNQNSTASSCPKASTNSTTIITTTTIVTTASTRPVTHTSTGDGLSATAHCP